MYQSPLHILSDWDGLADKLEDPAELLRLRKRLLAEFNLSQTATIEVNGTVYSKDDVIKTIDQLLDNPKLSLHVFIFSHKDLLDFLENDDSDKSPLIIKNLTPEPEIKEQLQPILYDRLSFRMKRAFLKKDFDEIIEVYNSQADFEESAKDNFYEDLHRNIRNLVAQNNALPDFNIAEMDEELAYLKNTNVAWFFNALPEEFSGIKDVFITSVINTLVAYQKIGRSHKKDYTFWVSEMLMEMDCDEELMDLIRKNHKIFGDNFEGSGSGGMSPNRILYFVVVIIIMLGRIATCNHNDTNPLPYQSYTPNSINLEQFSNPVVPTNKSSDINNFQIYRTYILDRTKDANEYNFRKFPVTLNETTRQSPFEYLLKSDISIPETEALKVIIENKTPHELIVAAFSETSGRAAYFFKNKPDTFSYRANETFCFYFGDSLYKNKSVNLDAIVTSQSVQNMGEVYFLTMNKDEIYTLEKNFGLFIKPLSAKNKKKPQLPKLILTPKFFDQDSIETSVFKLYCSGSGRLK